MQGNWIAALALLTWPLVVIWLFRTRPVGKALLLSILGAYMLLPVGTALKIQGIPAFDKISIPNLAALVGCMIVARRFRLWNRLGLPEILLFIFIVGPLVTAQLNPDPIVIGGLWLPGESAYDGVSAIAFQFLFILPFFLGRQVLRSAEDTVEIMRLLVLAGLIYSIPIFVELRMSPQLHNWVYGYHAHLFAQQIRDGGYRPTVFMGHGLIVSFFIMTAVVAAAALWRARISVTRFPPAGVTAYLYAILVLCKSSAALVYGTVTAFLVRWMGPRTQIRIAILLAGVALLFPVLRATDVFPAKALVEFATSINPERAVSLSQRFENEDRLLKRAMERPVFGWGRWGRSRVYDEYGKDISVTDGRWVITFGLFGVFGYIAEFGLLFLSVLRASSAMRNANETDQIFLAALALIVAIMMIDQLPNSSLGPWGWLITGALMGRAEALRAARRSPAKARPSTEQAWSAPRGGLTARARR